MRSGGKIFRLKKPWGENGGNLTGTCAGLAHFFGVNPLVFRGAFIVGAVIAPFFTVLGYLLLAGFMPDQKGFSFFADTDWEELRNSFSQKQPIKKNKNKNELEIRFDICENCNTAVREGSKFCHNCGTRI